jgi:hypothetical protein
MVVGVMSTAVYILEEVLDLSVGQVCCTATVAMRVTKSPASCGCSGQSIVVRLSLQAQNPAAVPIKLAISVILQVVMIILSARGAGETFLGSDYAFPAIQLPLTIEFERLFTAGLIDPPRRWKLRRRTIR